MWIFSSAWLIPRAHATVHISDMPPRTFAHKADGNAMPHTRVVIFDIHCCYDVAAYSIFYLPDAHLLVRIE